MCGIIVSIPDHCLPFYSTVLTQHKKPKYHTLVGDIWQVKIVSFIINNKIKMHVKLFEIIQVLSTESSQASTKKGKRKVQGVPQSQTAALPRPQEEEKTDKSKQAQTEQTFEKN